MKLKQMAAGILLAISSYSHIHAQQIVNLNTGVYHLSDGTSSYIPFGTAEDTWKLIMPGDSSEVTPWVCKNATNPANGNLVWGISNCSRWITPSLWSGTEPLSPVPSGIYEYLMRFTLQTGQCLPSAANVFFNVLGADNNITGFKLNGHNYPLGIPTADDFNPMGTNIPLILDPTHLVPGVNTISIMMENGISMSGLNVCGTLTIDFNKSPLLPSIIGPASFCAGVAPTFSGSDGPAANAEAHYWESSESDINGIQIPGVSSNFSQWNSGSPGNIIIPANLFTCGKYYRIKLATTGPCNWTETIKVIYITCGPAANAGADQTICEGECTNIGISSSGNFNYSWSYMNGGSSFSIPGNASRITVCPTNTTTYTVTTTNNNNGCSKKDDVTVSVRPNNPAFSAYINTTNPSFYTVEAIPNYTSGLSLPGFQYHWQIEELDPIALTPYYTLGTQSCWWTYPSSTTFKGFVSLAGNATQASSCTGSTPAGKFLYNRMYKISRATMTSNCSWKWSSVIIQTTKSGKVTVMEVKPPAYDPNTNSLGTYGNEMGIDEVANDVTFNVFPNPSTGMYTVSLDNVAEGTMDVFDVTGKKVLTQMLRGESTITFDLTNFAKGVYVVNLHANGRMYSQKIVLE